MDKNNIKIVIAVVCLLIAGIVVAWQVGLFGGGSSSSRPSQDVTYEDGTEISPQDRDASFVDPDTGGTNLGGQDDAFRMPGRRR